MLSPSMAVMVGEGLRNRATESRSEFIAVDVTTSFDHLAASYYSYCDTFSYHS